MKVTSPIGDLPFKLQRLRVTREGIEMCGTMGAWPARVQIGPRDLLDLVWVAALPLAVITVAVVATILAFRAV